MDSKDKENYIKRYTERFHQFGYDPRTLGWSDDKIKQKLRFIALANVGDLNNKTILDIGCGFGDFYGFLKDLKINVNYIGIDIVPILLENAKKLWPSANFYEYDILNDNWLNLEADYVFASGIFNAKVQTLGGNTNYIEAMINKMFEISRVGVCADFFSSYVDYQHEIAYHTSPEWIFSVAKKLSKRICIRHDYLPFEFCLYIYKNDKTNGTRFMVNNVN
jgi:SAM-dependent methyltransferase